uniref:Integrase catalytic domain-containing protein n=1 Tax=Monopterus albus TaxID=43700 RepID=A0A3Q3J668_MONAL
MAEGAADLLQWQNGNYLVLIDYFSCYIEVCNLPAGTSAKQTIARFKAVFARHGCLEILVTDNGLQFSCQEFFQFARDYDFTHVTSSPRYPRSNGDAKRAVRTVKSLLEKGGDLHKALLAYRSTPLAHRASPAQLLMGRRIRTPVPVLPDHLQPQWPDLKAFRDKDTSLKLQQLQTFNRRHRARGMPPLQPGQQVWIKPTHTKGTVIGPASTPRSYEVETQEGGQMRRNRSHHRGVPGTPTSGNMTVTRSGRLSKAPEKLDL